MRFFEFNNFPYYALIGAEAQEDSMKCYKEEVSGFDEDSGVPDEITEAEARQKFDFSGAEEPDLHQSFDETIKFSPAVILIDSELV